MAVPTPIIDAALKAIEEQTSAGFRHKYGAAEKWHVVVALSTAMPLIAADERRRCRRIVHAWLVQICATRGERSAAAAAVRSIYTDLAPGYTVLRCAWPGGCPASVSAGTDTEARQLAERAGWQLGERCNTHATRGGTDG